MTPKRWQRVDEIFQAAIELKAEERPAFIERACVGDEELRREVESLITADEQGLSLVEESAFQVVAGLLATGEPELAEGQSFDHYEIVGLIGRGGMGEVYLAKDKLLKRRVALKLLPAAYTRNQDRIRRFQQEAQAASALNHPNILTIYELGQVNGQQFIATEFVEGETLRQRLKRAPLNLAETFGIAIQICNALLTAHNAGIVHRDIKPENIMLRRDGYVKVLDFGLAKLTEQHEPATRAQAAESVNISSGWLMGTVKYMSPEQARGLSVDPRSDIFSFGVVLYEMLAARPPFEGDSSSELIAAIMKKEPPPLTDVPDEMKRLVSKALHKKKEERYQTMQDLLGDLKSLQQDKAAARGGSQMASATSAASALSTSEAAASSTESTSELVVSRIKRKVRSSTFGMVAMVVLAAAASYFSWSENEKAINSLAILPFEQVGSDSNVEYLSTGIADYLTNRLSRLPGLTVISNIAAARYKPPDQTSGQDLQAVGRELKVQAVVRGKVAQQGGRLQVRIELVDVQDKRQLLAKEFDQSATDILSVQEDILRSISEKLKSNLIRKEQPQLSKRHTESTQAYQLYLRGRYAWNKRTEPELRKAIGFFDEAIGIDPQYSLAYVGLADAYQVLIFNGGLPPSAYCPRARAAAERAIEIDDTLAEAHTTLAYVKYYYEWDWQGAEREFKRAIELNPNYATAHQWYGEYLGTMGRPEESLGEREKALRLDPLSPIITSELGFAYLYARQYARAIEEFRKAAELYPDFAPAHDFLAYAYEQSGRYDEALVEYQKAIALAHNGYDFIALARTNAKWGRRSAAQKLLAAIAELSKQKYFSPTLIAEVYAALGDKDKSFAWLDNAYQNRDWALVQLKVAPEFDSLRSDPRFGDIMKRMNRFQ